MSALRTLACGMVLTMAADTRADDVLYSHRLPEALESDARSASWTVAGALAGPVHVLPSGEIAALVAAGGTTSLVRWSAAGEERFRRALEAQDAAVVASRLRGDGTLMVVTRASLVVLRIGDGAVVERRPHGLAIGDARVEASPDGAWVAFPDRVVYAGRDGTGAEVRMPIAVPASPRNGLETMLATDRNECLLSEIKVLEHAVKARPLDPDLTTERVVTLVGPRGAVLAQAALGGTETRWEWFWREENANSPVPIPKDAGLVRTRYEGQIAIDLWTERPGGDFLLVVWEAGARAAQRRELLRLDHALRERWRRPYRGGAGLGASPASVAGLLVHSGAGRVRSVDDQGRSDREAYLSYPPRPDLSGLRGAAIGRDPAGGWIVVEYGERRGGR